MITKVINIVLDNISIRDNLTDDIIKRYNLISLDNAIRQIHFPKNKQVLNDAIERLKFQELFTYSLKLMMLKNKVNNKEGIEFRIFTKELIEIKKSLPYDLTNAQNKVIRQILHDAKRPVAMNRLVQGDVGSGKTLVALIALLMLTKTIISVHLWLQLKYLQFNILMRLKKF